MTVVLTGIVVLALVVLAGLALATALGRPLERASAVGLRVVEALLVVNAVVDVARLVGGSGSGERVTHLGYVLVSVVLIPVLVRPLDDDATDDDVRGRQLVLVVACVALVVVVLRQAATA